MSKTYMPTHKAGKARQAVQDSATLRQSGVYLVSDGTEHPGCCGIQTPAFAHVRWHFLSTHDLVVDVTCMMSSAAYNCQSDNI